MEEFIFKMGFQFYQKNMFLTKKVFFQILGDNFKPQVLFLERIPSFLEHLSLSASGNLMGKLQS